MTVRILENGIMNGTKVPFDGSIAVTKGDAMYLDTDDVKPASSQADGGSEIINQITFARKFAGFAGDTRKSTDTTAVAEFPVYTDVVAEVTVASSTFVVGDMLAIDEASSGTALLNTTFSKTTAPAAAVGTVIENYATATTTVKARFVSRVLEHTYAKPNMLGVQTNTETLTDAKTLVASDARIQNLDPGGSARNVTLPAPAGWAGDTFLIVNAADAAEIITVKNSAGTTLCTPTQSEYALCWSDGTNTFAAVLAAS